MNYIPDLERILFYPGELLTADDLTTLDGNNRELRWLHNRTLHNWGIGYGLNIQGSRGDTSVTVNPGYANDVEGREIILSSPLQQPIPAVPGPATYYLVANYVDDADEATEEQRGATACSPGGAVRLSNAPAILWKTLAQLNSGIDVVLGQVSIQNCVLKGSVSTAVRRYAYTSAPKFSLSTGQIAAKDIKWTSWKIETLNIGFKAHIDTSAAKFQSTPGYVAQIVGSRSVSSPAVVIADFVSVSDESPTGFNLQLALPNMGSGINTPAITDPTAGPKLMVTLGWVVTWMGVEN